MAILKFRHDRAGDSSALIFEIAADGSHGAIGPLGISPRVGFARGVIDADGWAKAARGGDYTLNDAQFEGAEYRLTVKRGSAPISTVHFVPLAKNGVVDVNALTSAGRPQSISPEELRGVRVITADAQAAAAEARAQGQELAQALADTAQAGAEALALAGIDPAYISETTADPPLAPKGTKGARRTPEGGVIRLESDGAAWQVRGEAVPGRGDLDAVRGEVQAKRADLTPNYRATANRIITEFGAFEVVPEADPVPANGVNAFTIAGGKKARKSRANRGTVNVLETGAAVDNNTDDSDALLRALDALRDENGIPAGKLIVPRTNDRYNPVHMYIAKPIVLDLGGGDKVGKWGSRLKLDLGTIRFAPGASITIRDGCRMSVRYTATGGAVDEEAVIVYGCQHSTIDAAGVGYRGTVLRIKGNLTDRMNIDTFVRTLRTYSCGRPLRWGDDGGYCEQQGMIGYLHSDADQNATQFVNTHDLTIQYYENHIMIRNEDGTKNLGAAIEHAGWTAAIHYGKCLIGGEVDTLMTFSEKSQVHFDHLYMLGEGKNGVTGIYLPDGAKVTASYVNTGTLREIVKSESRTPNVHFEQLADYKSKSLANLNKGGTILPPIVEGQPITFNPLSGPQAPVTTLAVGGTEKWYENKSPRPQQIVVSGGTVTETMVQRIGVQTAVPGPVPMLTLAPGDLLRVKYSQAPTMTVIPQ